MITLGFNGYVSLLIMTQDDLINDIINTSVRHAVE